MKALITGAAGFVGKHLIDCLRLNGWETIATKLPSEKILNADFPVYDLDILNGDAFFSILETVSPDCVFHLAAQSSVSASWTNPALTIDINIKGALNALEGALKASKRPRVLLIGSSEEYGNILPGESPVSEDALLRPGNIYASAKVMQGYMGLIYARAHGLEVVITRAFNHIGPGQSDAFALSSFCKQAEMIRAGLSKPVIKVGNLDAKRDFTDVRDIVRAYRLLAEKGESGRIYNIGCGKAVSINEALQTIISLSGIDIKTEQDPSRMRPSDTPVIEADIARLSALTGWKPEIPIEKSFSDTLLYWREKIANDVKS